MHQCHNFYHHISSSLSQMHCCYHHHQHHLRKIRTKWTKGHPFSLKIVAHFYIKVCHQYSIQFTIQIKQSLSKEVKCNLRIPLCSLWLCTTRPLITVISHPTPCKVNRVERYLLFFEQAQMLGLEVGKIFTNKVCPRQARNPKQIWPVDFCAKRLKTKDHSNIWTKII